MNKFSKVFEDAKNKTYKVAVETMIGEAKVQGSFTLEEKTRSLAQDKAKQMVKEQNAAWTITGVSEVENN